MPSIREMSAAPPKRLIARIAVGVGFVLVVGLYAAHVEAQKTARIAAAAHALALTSSEPAKALVEATAAQDAYGKAPDIARATWAALMAGGGRHGSAAMIKWTLAYKPSDPAFRLMFSKDSRFLAALDGNTVTVWNVEDGSEVLATRAGAPFIGYWRIGAQHFGLLSSYQYYDLVNSVIELPDGFRYAQPSKDALTAVAPGGDWAYRVPVPALNRTDYPVKLVNLHTSEKREVDIRYSGMGEVAVNNDATRVANLSISFPNIHVRPVPWEKTNNRRDIFVRFSIPMWDARSRKNISSIIATSEPRQLYFSRAQSALIVVAKETTRSDGSLQFFDESNGAPLYSLTLGAGVVADDLKGHWFAVATGDKIKVYRGMNNAALGYIADHEVSRPAPATSH
ncbi:MAG TPA: hypothetical protein VHL34_02430 [Rhizomicrobium sp.]|jgi:hypothetical protein|nr:hypothetical protein [Rhizomicrobium sp.]